MFKSTWLMLKSPCLAAETNSHVEIECPNFLLSSPVYIPNISAVIPCFIHLTPHFCCYPQFLPCKSPNLGQVCLSFWPGEGNPRRHNGGQDMLIQKFLAGIANMAAFSREAPDPQQKMLRRSAATKMVKHLDNITKTHGILCIYIYIYYVYIYYTYIYIL